MTLKVATKFILPLLAGVTLNANAGLVTQHTSINTYQRTCPGVANANYVNNWREAIQTIYGLEPAEVSADLTCHFNGGFQARFYNNDGTPKPEYSGLPNGAAFTNAEVGTLEITQVDGSTEAILGTPDGKYYGEVILDESNLGLPQIKIKSESDALERNSVNGFAATEFLWTGEAETLEYTVDFDFFASGNAWNLDDAADFYDYIFTLDFGAAMNMILEPGETFPLDWGTTLASDSFSTVGEPLLVSSEEDPYRGSLTVSFNVNTGDQFFLYGWAQAFGLNGGFADASHTVTSQLAIQGQSAQQSAQVFASALQPAVPTQVPVPATLLLMLMGLGGLVIRRS